jgi:catechol 2,3-dioxygenase-like lactoylglutathione lyase family enzyme
MDPGTLRREVPRILPLLLLMACASGPSSASRLDRVPNGAWGGEHVSLSVEDIGAAIEFDCAHGRLVREGGPARKDQKEEARPARYKGETDGRRMTLEIVFEGGESGGTFRLGKDEHARLVKCL